MMNKVTISIKDSITKPFAEDLNALFAKYGGDMVWDWRVEHVDDDQMFAGNYIDNLLKEYRDAKSGNTEPDKPIEDNYPNNLHNWGFALDSPEHQLLAAAIDYAQSKRGLDQEWGSYCSNGYTERLKGMGSNMQTTKAKPLLVVSFKGGFDPAHARAMNDSINRILADKGWYGIVIDKMDKAQVQAFGVDASTLYTLSFDELIELLEGVKRLREAAREGDRP